jgi:P pilus assembly chaperone PapD
MDMHLNKLLVPLVALGASFGFASSARAEMVLSQMIVDLMPGRPPREDIEVFNNGEERMYVLAEPSEIIAAGTAQERREPLPVSDLSDILVTPNRLVLEPGERRTIRIAFIGVRPLSDRVYRVAIKPVAGKLAANESALKLMVGFDNLVLVRPMRFTGDIQPHRQGQTLTLRNTGNTAQELFEGKQCSDRTGECRDLPAKRLYPGATWEQSLPFATPVKYKSAIGSVVKDRQF